LFSPSLQAVEAIRAFCYRTVRSRHLPYHSHTPVTMGLFGSSVTSDLPVTWFIAHAH